MIKRYYSRLQKLVVYLFTIFLDGYTKAKFFKKIGFFHAQGEGCYFSNSNFGNEPYLVEVGNNVYFAADVRLVNHDMSAKVVKDIAKTSELDKFGVIKIGSYVFLGLGVIVMPGVTICDRVVVAAGSVISKNIMEDGVYAGVPAKKIMEIDTYIEKIKKINSSYPWRKKNKSPTKTELISHFFSE